MDARWKNSWMFAAGSAAGAILAVWAYATWFAGPDPGASATAYRRPAAVAGSTGPETQLQAAAPAACDFPPVVAARGTGDGRFGLHAALQGHSSGDPAPFLAVAEEAAVQGRPRDAEVALIAACRVASRLGASVPLADVEGRLAQHYTTVAAHEQDTEQRSALMRRAEKLLAGSVASYEHALGAGASRTRMAEQRLAAFRQGAAGVMAGGASPRAEDTTASGAPAMSLANRPPRSDEDLDQIEADVRRLYEQAQNVSRDPGAVRRRHEAALQRRAACQSHGCLREWYTQRRRELFAEFQTAQRQ